MRDIFCLGSDMLSRRSRFAFASWFSGAAALLAVITVGCTKRETAVASGNRTGTLHFGNAAEPRDLDPQTNIGETDGNIINALFEGLVSVDNDGATLHPAAAEKWEISPNGKIYTFHLRANARWTNGEKVTAQDFDTAFMRLLDPALACEAASQAYFIEGAQDFVEGRSTDRATVGIRVIDPLTFQLTLRNRTPSFLGMLASWPFLPVHRATLEKFDGLKHRDTAWTKPKNLVGNGRFILKEWHPGQLIIVEKNQAHWDAEHTLLNAIYFYPIEDQTTEEHAFRAGQLHVTNGVPESKLASYRTAQPSVLSLAPLRRTRYVTFNTKAAPFQDERVRRAFALAIDRKRLVAAAYAGVGEPAYSLTRPNTGGYTPPEGFRFDPEEARRLLAEAGFPGGKGFPIVECMLTGKAGSVVLEGEVLQEMWAQNLGVHVTLQPTEWKVYLNAIRIKKFQCVFEAWGYVNDPWDPLQVGVTNNPNNDADWSNADYDRAFVEAERAPDDQSRHVELDRMEKILATSVPYAPLGFSDHARLVQPSVKNWRDTPIGMMNWREFSLDPTK